MSNRSRVSSEEFDPSIVRQLEVAYEGIDERAKLALARNGLQDGREPRTLAAIGEQFGVSRERVRQLEKAARAVLVKVLSEAVVDWADRISRNVHPGLAVSGRRLSSFFGGGDLGYALVLPVAENMGMVEVDPFPGWFTFHSSVFADVVQSLQVKAPVYRPDWDEAYERSGLPAEFYPVLVSQMGLETFRSYYVRAGARYDLISAVLASGPLSLDEIAKQTGLSANAVRGGVYHYDDFVPLSKGVWALKGTVEEPKYKSALPAILDILEREGPQWFPELARKVVAVHDVSEWRIKQCLDDFRIGSMDDGRIWLVSSGASKDRETEPVKPDYMSSHGARVGVRMQVTFDHARGSGFILNRWLCWWLGLRSAPQSMAFDSENGLELRVTRTGSGASVSTIKAALDSWGIVEGCDVVLLLDRDTRFWSLNHVCSADCGTAGRYS